MRDTIRKSANRYSKRVPKNIARVQSAADLRIAAGRLNAELVSDILVRVRKAEASERTMRLEAARAQTELAELREKLIGTPSPADRNVLLALARHINRVCKP